MGKLDGKIALITGGSEGMGYGTAEEFIREGAFVFITGRRKAELDKAVAELGPQAHGIVADAGSIADLERMYAEIQQTKGKLDVVFANAGIFPQVPVQQVTEEVFDSLMNVNVKGVFFTVQKALPLMDATGSIILNASFLKDTPIVGMSVYAATKAAVRSLARSFTTELRNNGPRVNVISPGPILTHGNREALKNEQVEQFITGMVPLGRIGKTLEIAKAAVFLASEDSAFVAGVDLAVDGGLDAV